MFDSILQKILESDSTVEQGNRFEILMRNFLLTDPIRNFSEVWMWNDFPLKNLISANDIGIDLVAKNDLGEFVAIQCKCYDPNSTVQKPDIDSFLATSSKSFGENKFIERILISTAPLGENARKATENQNPPVKLIGLEELQNASVDWEKIDRGEFGDSARLPKKKLREDQIDAINAVQKYFENHSRGKLIMACGTGKTLVSLKIAEQESRLVLYLVPSIALLSQVLSEFMREASTESKKLNPICVCSDDTSQKFEDEIKFSRDDLPLPATTDSNEIKSRIRDDRLNVIFSTYQSIEAVAEIKENFDLIICDEAHRTTGQSAESPFVRVHDENFIHSKKRLYMTATPRFYSNESKLKANSNHVLLWSMDDESIYGEEIFKLTFTEAVKNNILCDYKIIVCAITEGSIPKSIQDQIAENYEGEIPSGDIEKVIGSINSLSKIILDKNQAERIQNLDPLPMKKAVAFASTVDDSKRIANLFPKVREIYYREIPPEDQKMYVQVATEHVDGSMNSIKRNAKINWLRTDSDSTKILSNVRCLSEGVDVPALDSVIFIAPRKSFVDVVQAVGRVMRRAPGKNFGYVIIPIIVAAGNDPAEVLSKSPDTSKLWKILNVIRSIDPQGFSSDIFAAELNSRRNPDSSITDISDKILFAQGTFSNSEQLTLDFKIPLIDPARAIKALIVEQTSDREYLAHWAKNVAEIADRHKKFILESIDTRQDYREAFKEFLDGLRNSVNKNIDQDSAIDMISQHFIARPVFDALFTDQNGNSIIEKNPVSKSMQRMLDLLQLDERDKDHAEMKRFYDWVKSSSAKFQGAARQDYIREIYNNFFKVAMKETTEKLGIVYTPVEVVDFILKSVDKILERDFGYNLSSQEVQILDPFAGTGTFITRMFELGLIRDADLYEKLKNSLRANEIVLLAYYIACVNIETAYQARSGNYETFTGICLTDTFELYQKPKIDQKFSKPYQPTLFDVENSNSDRVEKLKDTSIQVIIGNPPYSVSKSDVDYKELDKSIAETYAARSTAQNKNSLYDSYVKAFRWASDRLDKDAGGIIAFVSNGGWIDGLAFDGFRKTIAEDFSKIYVFNLLGNARLSGEARRRGGGGNFRFRISSYHSDYDSR